MALPPVFVEFIGSAGKLYATTAAVKKEVASVNGGGSHSLLKKSAAAAQAFSLAIVGAAGLAAIAGVKMATEMQKQMELLVTAGGYAQSSIKGLTAGVLQVAAQTGEPIAQLTDGMYTIAKAGIPASSSLEVLRVAAQGAIEEGSSMTTVMQGLTSVMYSYHIPAKGAVSAMNEMKRAAGESKTTMQDFSDSLSNVVPFASQVGISFADLGGAIGVMTNHGDSAQRSTQDLSNAITGLTAPNGVAITMMQQLGINVVDLQKNVGKRGLAATYKILTDAIKAHTHNGLIDVGTMKQAASASQDLQTMMAGMSPKLRAESQAFLAGHVSAKEYRLGIKALGAVGYAQGSQFISLASNTKGFSAQMRAGQSTSITATQALQKMTGGVTGMRTAIMLTGDNAASFAEKTKAIAAAAKHAGANVVGWGTISQTLSVQIAQLKQTINGWLVQIGEKLIPLISKVVTWLMKHKDVVKEVVIGMGAFAAVWLVVNAIASVGVIGIIVLALMGLAAELKYAYDHSKTFRDILQKVGDVLSWLWKNILEPVAKFLRDAFVLELKLLWWWLKLVWKMISDMGKIFNWLWKNILEPVAKFIGDHFSPGIKAFMTALNGLGKAVVAIGDGFKWVWQHILVPIGQFFAGKFKQAVQIAVAEFKFFQQIPGEIRQLWGELVGWFKGLWHDITSALSGAANWLLRIGGDILGGLWHGIQNAWKGVIGFFGGIGHWIVTQVSGAVHWLESTGHDIMVGLWHGIGQAWLNVLTWFQNLGSNIASWLGDAGSWLLNTGYNILTGLWNGIQSALGWIGKQIGNLAGTVVGMFKSAFGIKSPSRMMAEEVGKYIPMGIAQGMMAHAYHVQDAADSIAAGLSGMSYGSPSFGGMGSGGGHMVNISVTVQGSVTSEHDLMQTIKTQMLQNGARVGAANTYQAYRR